MRKNQLGNTPLEISALGLGTVALGMAYGITPQDEQDNGGGGMTPPSLLEATRLIQQAIDGGITFIDTARGYGRSEEVLGHALQGRRDAVVLASKMSIHAPDGSELRGSALRRHMQASLSESLRLLQTDHIDLMMLHSTPADYAESVGILREFQQQGHIGSVGASTYGTQDPLRAIAAGVDALQVAYNVLDQRMDDIVFPKAAAAGVGIVVRSVFLKGVLTPRSADLPSHLAALKARADAVEQFAAAQPQPMTLIEAALRFVIANPAVSTTLVGVRTTTELDTSLQFANAEPLATATMHQFRKLRWDDEHMLNPSTWNLS